MYQPGTLRVVAYKSGRKWAADVMKTAGLPAGFKVEPDRRAIRVDGRDLAFVTL